MRPWHYFILGFAAGALVVWQFIPAKGRYEVHYWPDAGMIMRFDTATGQRWDEGTNGWALYPERKH